MPSNWRQSTHGAAAAGGDGGCVSQALSKFLRCVPWNNYRKVMAAQELMARWEPISGAAALELLSSSFSQQPYVRQFAVEALARISDEVRSYLRLSSLSLSFAGKIATRLTRNTQELSFYLLMLVQGLRYELAGDASLAELLINRATRNSVLGTNLYWYMFVESEDPVYGSMYGKRLRALTLALSKTPEGKKTTLLFKDQQKFVQKLREIAELIASMGGSHDRKIQRMRELLADNFTEDFQTPLPLPLDPNVRVTGFVLGACWHCHCRFHVTMPPDRARTRTRDNTHTHSHKPALQTRAAS